jgi:hypothetical protein
MNAARVFVWVSNSRNMHLQFALCRCQPIALSSLFIARKKIVRVYSTYARVVRRELHQIKAPVRIAPAVQLTGNVARESERIVIGMPTFIGVRHHNVGFHLLRHLKDAKAEFVQSAAELLVCEVQVGNLAERQVANARARAASPLRAAPYSSRVENPAASASDGFSGEPPVACTTSTALL